MTHQSYLFSTGPLRTVRAVLGYQYDEREHHAGDDGLGHQWRPGDRDPVGFKEGRTIGHPDRPRLDQSQRRQVKARLVLRDHLGILEPRHLLPRPRVFRGARVSGNPTDSPWYSTPRGARKRRPIEVTLSNAALSKLERLSRKYAVARSRIVERLIMDSK